MWSPLISNLYVLGLRNEALCMIAARASVTPRFVLEQEVRHDRVYCQFLMLSKFVFNQFEKSVHIYIPCAMSV